MKIFNIEFAPLFVPLERRLQTFSVLAYLFIFFQGLTVIGLACLAMLLFTPFFWLPALYLIYYIIDFNNCEKGGYMSHPHGILCCGIICSFSSDGSDFYKTFPGLTPHCLTLKANFYGPLTREYNLLCGSNVASRDSLQYILTNQGRCKEKGQVCILVPGGAEESLHVQPGSYILVLKNRKGFIRAALKTGASLVPVFSFGENDLYSTIKFEKGTLLRKIQDTIKKWTSIAFPIAWGRGVFNYTFGLLPRRVPINIVIGAPIDVERIEHPTHEQVDALHARYIQELTKLFEENKGKYVQDKNAQLVIQ